MEMTRMEYWNSLRRRPRLGGLYTLPYDHRLRLPFQDFEINRGPEEFTARFLSFMEELINLGGSFEVRDFDDSSKATTIYYDKTKHWEGVAFYGHDYKRRIIRTITAQDAEEYFINIPPIAIDSDVPAIDGTCPWRRLM
jgi:hypothetical protein